MADDWDETWMTALGSTALALTGVALWYYRRALLGAGAGAAPPLAMAPVMAPVFIPPLVVGVAPLPGAVGPPVAPPLGVGIPPPPGPPPPPPVLHAAPIAPLHGYQGIADELARSPRVQLIQRLARVRGMDVGHLFARHGHDVSDLQLQARLLTGLDREGVPAPTAGVSSRFTTAQSLTDTVVSVAQQITLAFTRTRTALAQNIRDYAQAENSAQNLLGLAALPGPPRGPAIALAMARRAQERLDLLAAVAGTQGAGAVGGAPTMPVYWHDIRQRIELYQRYVFIHSHGVQVGTGYYGTQPQAPTGAGPVGNITLYGQANAYQGPLTHTLTVLTVPGDRALGRRHEISQWQLITHYPTGQTNGGNPLTLGFDDYSGIV